MRSRFFLKNNTSVFAYGSTCIEDECVIYFVFYSFYFEKFCTNRMQFQSRNNLFEAIWNNYLTPCSPLQIETLLSCFNMKRTKCGNDTLLHFWVNILNAAVVCDVSPPRDGSSFLCRAEHSTCLINGTQFLLR